MNARFRYYGERRFITDSIDKNPGRSKVAYDFGNPSYGLTPLLSLCG